MSKRIAVVLRAFPARTGWYRASARDANSSVATPEAGRLAALLGDLPRAAALGARARAHAERYRWERVTGELEALYASYVAAMGCHS